VEPPLQHHDGKTASSFPSQLQRSFAKRSLRFVQHDPRPQTNMMMNATRSAHDSLKVDAVENSRRRSPHRSTIAGRPNPKKTFVVVNNECDDALNLSSCSSLTNDSDLLSMDNERMDELVLFKPPQQDPFVPSKRAKKGADKKSKSVSYAQLFFDPETKMLVTLMEVNLHDRTSMWNINESIEVLEKQNDLAGQTTLRGKEKNESTVMPSMAGEESRFQDQTMLTECSSNSSETGREGPEQFSCNVGTRSLRFSDEPVVFSHNGRQVWLEENDLSLYLLHDSSDPWEVGIHKSSVGCTETLKRLLMLRSCISLASIRQVGDTKKWRSDGSQRMGENMAYAALKEM
jgi:hypothetical protein